MKLTGAVLMVAAGTFIACGDDGGAEDREMFLTKLVLGTEVAYQNEIFLFCEGAGPSSLSATIFAPLGLGVVDDEHVDVTVHSGCTALAVAGAPTTLDDGRKQVQLQMPAFTCTWPAQMTINGEAWLATLRVESTTITLRGRKSADGTYDTELISGFDGTLTRTDPGKSAICEYSYFVPDPAPFF